MSKKKKRNLPPYLRLVGSSRDSRSVTLSFKFSLKAYARLEEIKARAQSASNAGLIQDALRTFDFILDLRDEGKSLQIVSKDGDKEHVEIIF